jgi:DNA-nicking Smr family endonuclease
MQQHNMAAAAAILDPQRVGTDGWGSTIDLHGLFVQEAIQATNDFLNFHTSNLSLHGNDMTNVSVNIITGVGHHSVDNLPKIKPAVKKLLEDRERAAEGGDGVRYTIAPLGGDGGFQVTLSVDPESPVFAASGGGGVSAQSMFESAAFESQELE